MDWMQLAEFLGGSKGDVAWWQMSLRGLVIFAYGLMLVRFPGQRIFGKSGAFDIVLAVLVGSNLSRALTGNAPLFATLAATTAIVLFHWVVAHLATRSHLVSWLAKGAVVQLVRDGFVFHGLRKSAAVAYAMVGCSTKEIAAITGQSDQMVAHYTKGVERGRLAKAAVVKLESANKKGRSRRGK